VIAAKKGRDKLTLLLPNFETCGLWVEQLVAESTGKNRAGVIPIAGEPIGQAGVYGDDRLFVDLRGKPSTLRPAVEYAWTDPLMLGAEFVRWEIATAIAGALLNINPFDEPNVQQAKDATNKLLDEFKAKGALPASPNATSAVKGDPMTLLATLKPGDYFAQLATSALRSAAGLDASARLRDRARVATTLGVGPRYLHSPGSSTRAVRTPACSSC
jgi:hypothetical protein